MKTFEIHVTYNATGRSFRTSVTGRDRIDVMRIVEAQYGSDAYFMVLNEY